MTDLVTLDAIELPPAPPSALRLFRDGWNDTVKGRFLLDAEGAAEILRRFAAHGVELAMDFDHGLSCSRTGPAGRDRAPDAPRVPSRSTRRAPRLAGTWTSEQPRCESARR